MEYENFFIGGFNIAVSQNNMNTFCDCYELKSLVKEETCYKNPERPLCIDVILTNSPCCFQNSCAIEIDLSDFHKIIFTVVKARFEKLKRKIINDRFYQNFSNDHFRNHVIDKLSFEIIKTNSKGLEKFLQICLNALDKFAPK